MIGGGILKRKCPKCNNPLPEEAHFCLHCFHDFNETQEDDQSAKLPLLEKIKQNKKALLIILAIFILLSAVATACGIYYSGRNSQADADTQAVTTQKHAVSTVTEKDGSVVTTYNDGSIETVKTDGTVITEEADGTVVTKKTDGTVVTEKTDGTTITEEPDGTVVTEKPDGTVITEKPDGTTEVTQKPTETTSEYDTTEPPVSEPSTETPSSDYSDVPINYNDFTFENRNGSLIITKYKGNDKIVRVPNSYNGDYVTYIEGLTFQNVDEVEQIIFEMAPNDTKLSFGSNAVWLCDNLKSVVFIRPDSNSAKLKIGGFAGKCPSLTDIQIYNCDDYRVYDYGLYCYDDQEDGYALQYFCEGAKVSEWTMPDWCVTLDNAVFMYNTNIKRVYIHSTKGFTLSKYTSNYMDAVYINDDNKYLFDDNGVAVYNENMKELQFFSSTANVKEYTIKSGYCFNPGRGTMLSNKINPNLEVLRIPKGADFMDSQIKKYFTSSESNLKTIYIEEGHPKMDFIKENFKGEIIIF